MVEVTDDCPVLRLTSSFVTWAVYGIRNIRPSEISLSIIPFTRERSETVILLRSKHCISSSVIVVHYTDSPLCLSLLYTSANGS